MDDIGMICTLDKNDYCERHKRRHVGRLRELSQLDDATGEKYRRAWDGLPPEVKLPAKPKQLKPGDKGWSCIHFGRRLRDDKGEVRKVVL